MQAKQACGAVNFFIAWPYCRFGEEQRWCHPQLGAERN
jgi:hypothetical protein